MPEDLGRGVPAHLVKAAPSQPTFDGKEMHPTPQGIRGRTKLMVTTLEIPHHLVEFFFSISSLNNWRRLIYNVSCLSPLSQIV